MTDDSFFEGGDKVTAFSYDGVAPISWEGTVVEIGNPTQSREVNYNPTTKQYETGDPKVWKSGDPIMQRRVVVQTDDRTAPDDDGRRAWFFEQGKEITKSMMQAVQAVRGKSMPEVGGWLRVTYTGNDPDSFKGSKKLFNVEYRAAETKPEDPWSTGPAAAPATPAYTGHPLPVPAPVPTNPLVSFLISKGLDPVVVSGMQQDQLRLFANTYTDAPR